MDKGLSELGAAQALAAGADLAQTAAAFDDEVCGG
jgi:hypothetical protein